MKVESMTWEKTTWNVSLLFFAAITFFLILAMNSEGAMEKEPTWERELSVHSSEDSALSWDGEYYALANSKYVRLYETRGGEELWNYESHTSFEDIAISKYGDYIVAIQNAGRMVYFTRENETPEWELDMASSDIDMSLDGKYVVAEGTNNNLTLLDGHDEGAMIWEMPLEGSPGLVDISDDGSTILACYGENNSHSLLVDRETQAVLWNRSFERSVVSVALSSSGNNFVVSSMLDGIYCFRRDNATLLWKYPQEVYHPYVDISEDGHYICSTISEKEQPNSEYVYLFGSRNNTPLKRFKFEGKNTIATLDMSGDGEFIMVSTQSGTPFHVYLFGKKSEDQLWQSTVNVPSYHSHMSHNGSVLITDGVYRRGHGDYIAYISFFDNRGPIGVIDAPKYWREPKNRLVHFNCLGYSFHNITSYQWTSSIEGALHTGPDGNFSTSSLSPGTHIINLTVEDDFWGWGEVAGTELVIHYPPRAIISHETPSFALENETIRLISDSWDDTGLQQGVWYSDRQGCLYNGSYYHVPELKLENGTHLISHRVQDDYQAWSNNVTHEIVVNGIPWVASFESRTMAAVMGVEIPITFSATDDQEGLVYLVTSDLEGELYNNVIPNPWIILEELGEHKISCFAVDVYGTRSAYQNMSVNITLAPQLVYSASVGVLLVGEELELDLSGSYDEDGEIVRYLVTMGDETLLDSGVEKLLVHSFTETGQLDITMMVQDGQSIWSNETTLQLTVHRRPTASIVSILPNPQTELEAVGFSGSGEDDGGIIRYAWRSSLDGEIYNGTGSTFSSSELSAGTHTIFLRVQDERGAWSAEAPASLTITEKEIGGEEDNDGDSPAFSLLLLTLVLGLVAGKRRRRSG